MYSTLIRALRLAALLGTAFSASATHTPETVAAWDCWIATDDPVRIRCIADRDSLERAIAENPAQDLEAVLLDAIHDAIHRGELRDIDRLLRDNPAVLRPGSMWTVYLYTLPTRESWLEGRPATLIRAVLCRNDRSCRVFLRERR